MQKRLTGENVDFPVTCSNWRLVVCLYLLSPVLCLFIRMSYILLRQLLCCNPMSGCQFYSQKEQTLSGRQPSPSWNKPLMRGFQKYSLFKRTFLMLLHISEMTSSSFKKFLIVLLLGRLCNIFKRHHRYPDKPLCLRYPVFVINILSISSLIYETPSFDLDCLFHWLLDWLKANARCQVICQVILCAKASARISDW